MDLTKYQAVAARMLEEIGPPVDRLGVTEWEGRRFELAEFPLPSLVRFALSNLLHLTCAGRGEKVAWSLDAAYRGVPFQLAERKSGFQIVVPKGTPDEVLSQLVKLLAKAASLAARSLRHVAEEQVSAGKVIIPSQIPFFEGSYQYFRVEATRRFIESATDVRALFDPNVREGGYLSAAMLNAYFSRLEHLLLLVLPFANFESGGDAIRNYAQKTWQDKLATVIDLSKDQIAKKFRDTLGAVAKNFRNPVSHGGYDKKDTMFQFYVPGIGYFPAHLNTGQITVERFVTPITKTDFELLCKTLDECDALLEQTTLAAGFQFAKVCAYVSFSTDFRDQCQRAARSQKELELFIDHHHFSVDQQVNMDW
jgi:hypothetical protein